jgi:anti-sigma regulatory factor (Ser/Thr protein kinase)
MTTNWSHTGAWSADTAHVADARRFVSTHLVAHGLGAVAPDACVVVSELATNAVLHAGTGFRVGLTGAEDAVLVRVSDSSPVLPLPRDGGPSLDGGRGLRIVAALCGDWGTVPEPNGGKSVWASIPTPRDGPDRREGQGGTRTAGVSPAPSATDA